MRIRAVRASVVKRTLRCYSQGARWRAGAKLCFVPVMVDASGGMKAWSMHAA